MWKMQLTLTDARQRSTRLEFTLGNFGAIPGDPFEFGTVTAAGVQIMQGLDALTDCEISQVSYTFSQDVSADYPLTGGSDVTDEAYFSLVLDTLIPATANHRIPAPVASILAADNVGLVIDDAAFVIYQTQLEQHTRYGQNGNIEIATPLEIRNSYWRSVARKSK